MQADTLATQLTQSVATNWRLLRFPVPPGLGVPDSSIFARALSPARPAPPRRARAADSPATAASLQPPAAAREPTARSHATPQRALQQQQQT